MVQDVLVCAAHALGLNASVCACVCVCTVTAVQCDPTYLASIAS